MNKNILSLSEKTKPMKKIFLLFFMIFFLGMVRWENTFISWTTQENIVHPWETKIINQSLDKIATTDLKNIRLVFCNASDQKKRKKELILDMRPWQRKEICVMFSNISDKPIGLIFWFAKWWINDNWGITCDEDITNTNDFSKQILYNTLTGIVVPASWSIIKNFSYKSPKDASWQTLGCAVYKLDKEEKIEFWKMFLLIVRNISYIYINNTWNVYNFWRWDDIKDVYTMKKDIILKIIIGILAILIIMTILQKEEKKKPKRPKKK